MEYIYFTIIIIIVSILLNWIIDKFSNLKEGMTTINYDTGNINDIENLETSINNINIKNSGKIKDSLKKFKSIIDKYKELIEKFKAAKKTVDKDNKYSKYKAVSYTKEQTPVSEDELVIKPPKM